ncbi:MAG: hypothetical protein M3O22_06325 [Pseudomonadota bacterium]|nr:hypothetical protein [Pseudomonadota bacterium]
MTTHRKPSLPARTEKHSPWAAIRAADQGSAIAWSRIEDLVCLLGEQGFLELPALYPRIRFTQTLDALEWACDGQPGYRIWCDPVSASLRGQTRQTPAKTWTTTPAATSSALLDELAENLARMVAAIDMEKGG